MDGVVISGIQQVGIGVTDVKTSWSWYRKYFGMDIRVFEDAAVANYMLPYTGGKPQERYAALALNLQGGGGFEIWQYTQRTPQPAEKDIRLGDLGFYCAKLRTRDANKAYEFFRKEGLDLISEPVKDPRGALHFYLKDPNGNVFDIIENHSLWFKPEAKHTSGAFGITVGCSNLEKSIAFYSDILGYDKVLYQGTECADINALNTAGTQFKRAILTHDKPRKGAFSRMFGPSEIELFECTDATDRFSIFEGRYWGDLGYIHLCFDVAGMDKLRTLCSDKGYPFTVDSSAAQEGQSFDMGEAAGYFSYIEDPDGALIEFVETHKVPILKKVGWYLNLKSRKPTKPLPNWMLKAFSFNRVKD
jgi:catechol 2,3-dioxygenase-like lactoylglutathione lyase family enzyme